MVQEKTTLATSSIGDLHNLIPSLKEQKTILNSFVAHFIGICTPY